jgi:hypothetical protein
MAARVGNIFATMGDDATIGEKMNRGMGLDPGFTLDRPKLAEAVRDMTDDTTKRAQRNVDQQRQNQADIEAIAAEMAAEADLPPSLEPEPPQPSMDVPHLHEYTARVAEDDDGA